MDSSPNPYQAPQADELQPLALPPAPLPDENVEGARFEGPVSLADVRQALALVLPGRMSWRARLVPLAAALLLIWALLFRQEYAGTEMTPVWSALLMLVGLMAFSSWIVLPRYARRLHAAFQRRPFWYVINEEAVHCFHPGSASRIQWPVYDHHLRSDSMLVLMLDTNAFQMIPRRMAAREADWQWLLDLVERKVPRKPR